MFTIQQPSDVNDSWLKDLPLAKRSEQESDFEGNAPDAAARTGDSRSFFNKLSSRITQQNVVQMPHSKTQEALLLLQNYEETRQGWFWSTNASGEITYLTDSISETFGKKPGELLGVPFVELFGRSEAEGSRQRTRPGTGADRRR